MGDAPVAPAKRSSPFAQKGESLPTDRHVLLIGGGSALQPLLRKVCPEVQTVVLCRATVLPWVHQLGDNQAIVVLHDGSTPERWKAVAQHIHDEWRVDHVGALAEIDQDRAAEIAAMLGV